MYATALAPAIGVYHLAAGDASLLSAPRRGSTFTVRLPMARRPEGAEDSSASGDRADDSQPSGPRARRAPDPLCRCS